MTTQHRPLAVLSSLPFFGTMVLEADLGDEFVDAHLAVRMLPPFMRMSLVSGCSRSANSTFSFRR
jgi:hypothetical protein